MKHENKKNKNIIKKIYKSKLFTDLLKYSVLFGIIMGFILYIFVKYRRGFVWRTDGLEQHYITLKYFRELLRNLITTGEWSTFIWNIGNGMDMFGNLAYYSFGDIFSYLSILSPEKYLHLFYYAMVVLRIYFIGISFLFFCKYKKIQKGNIIGALMYTFCGYAIFAGVRHPYFMNALILFPLLMIGIEKIVIENKKIFYTIIITLTTISNFYFAYSLFLIIAIYGTILTIFTYKEKGIKKILKKLMQVLGYSLIGVLMSAFILVPTIYAFLNCPRSGAAEILPYSFSYYKNFLEAIVVPRASYWGCFSVHPIILIILPIFFSYRKNKDNFPLMLFFTCLLVPLLISQVGTIFDGFSYPNNRWSFVIAFLFSYFTADFLNRDIKLEKKDYKKIGIFMTLYLLIMYILRKNISIVLQINLIITLISLLIIVDKEKLESKFKKINLYNICMTGIIVIGIMYTTYYFYDVEDRDYIDEFNGANSVEKMYSTLALETEDFSDAINFIKNKDTDFYKIGKWSSKKLYNVSMVKKYNSINYYYSIVPKKLDELSSDLENSQKVINKEIMEFDFRTKITTLLGNKYYINPKIVPYGYKKIKQYKSGTSIYENQYALPFAVLYTDYIKNADYEELNPVEKETSLLKTVALEGQSSVKYNNEVINKIKNESVKNIEFQIKDTDKLLKNNKITIKKIKQNKITLELNEITNGEIYVMIDNIKYEPYSKQELIELESKNETSLTKLAKIKNKYKWYQKDYSFNIKARMLNRSNVEDSKNPRTTAYYYENSQYLMNLGHFDKTANSITLEFSKIGQYSFDEIKIIAVSMDDYEQDINKLKKSNFKIEDYGNGFLNCKVNAEENGVLQFATMYDKGWKVYVDGNQVDTFEANKYFIGINITEGEHYIEIRYTTPYIKEGIIISIVSICVFISLIIIEKRKN